MAAAEFEIVGSAGATLRFAESYKNVGEAADAMASADPSRLFTLKADGVVLERTTKTIPDGAVLELIELPTVGESEWPSNLETSPDSASESAEPSTENPSI